MPEEKLLTIVSPAHGKNEVFRWKHCNDGEIRDENSEVVEIISWLIRDVDKLSDNDNLLSAFNAVDRSSYTSVSQLCSTYNNIITQQTKEWSDCGYVPKFLNRQASRDHVQFILLQCYNRAVAEPDKLNQYQPFSPQVYGETSFELISQMIDTVDVTGEDTFIDLGSGVGQVVLQVSACSSAKFCYGVEKADYPAYCASNLDTEFRHWMAFYGKSFRPYLLEKGDFLSRECHDRILSASVLFANNFAFGPEVDHQLKQKFANLREGARIISSKAFCPLNFRITDRNLGDIGSIMHVHCLNPLHDAVSWTDKPFSYYVHTIDRSLLERYFSRLKNPTAKDDVDAVRRDRKGRIISDQNLKDMPHVTNGLNQSRKATAHTTAVRQLQQGAGSSRRSRSLSAGLRVNNTSGLLPRRTNGMRHVRSSVDTTNLQAGSGDEVTFRQRRSAPSNRCKRSSRRSNQHKGRTTSRSPAYLEPSTGVIPLHLGSLSLEQPVTAAGAATHSAPATFPTDQTSGRTSPSGSTPDEDTGVFPADRLGKHRVPGYRQTASRTATPWSHSSASSSSSSSCLVASLASSRTTRSPNAGPTDSSAPLPPGGANPCYHQLEEQTSGSDAFTSSQEVADSLRLTLRLSADDYQLVVASANDDETGDSSVANRRAVRKCRQPSNQQQAVAAGQTASVDNNDGGGGTAPRLHRLSASRRYSTALRQRTGSQQSGAPASRLTKRQVVKGKSGRKGRQAHLRGRLLGRAESYSEGRHNNLNILHSETVAQIRKKPTDVRRELLTEAGRHNCPDMASFASRYSPTELRSVEAMRSHAEVTSGDPNIGHSQQPVPLALTQYLELTKRVLMNQFTAMRSVDYTEKVNAQLAREQLRKTELVTRLGQLEHSINTLHADGTELLQKFMKQLGFLISTPSVFFSQARKLIKHHHMLESKISRYREEITQLTSANQELVRRHQDEASRLISTVTGQVSSPLPDVSPQMTTASDLPPPVLVQHPLTPPLLTEEPGLTRFEPPPGLESRQTVPTCRSCGGGGDIPPPPQLTKVTCSASVPSYGNSSSECSNGLGGMAAGLPQAFGNVSHALSASSCRQSAVRPLLIIDRSPSATITTTKTTVPPPLPTTMTTSAASKPSPIDQTALPPPPPLLPMHHRQPPAQSTAVTADHHHHHHHHNNNNGSSSNVSPQHTRRIVAAKSIHASLQDLISHELNRECSAETEPPPPTLCPATVPHHDVSPFAPRCDSLHPRLGSLKGASGNSAMQQFMLPPRKRQWDPQADQSFATQASAGRHSQKLARRPVHQRRSSTPAFYSSAVGRGLECLGNLSPPPLSPGELGLPPCSPSSQRSPQSFLYPLTNRYPSSTSNNTVITTTTPTTTNYSNNNGSSNHFAEPVSSLFYQHSPATTLVSPNGNGHSSDCDLGPLVAPISGRQHQHHVKQPLANDAAPPPLLSKAVVYASPQTLVP